MIKGSNWKIKKILPKIKIKFRPFGLHSLILTFDSITMLVDSW